MKALQRLELAKEIVSLRNRYDKSWKEKANQYRDYQSAHSYLARLLGNSPSGIEHINPSTPLATLHDLSDYVDSLVGESEEERQRGALYVMMLLNSIFVNEEQRSGVLEKLSSMGLGNKEEIAEKIYAVFSDNKMFDAFNDEVAVANAQIESAKEKLRDLGDGFEFNRSDIYRNYHNRISDLSADLQRATDFEEKEALTIKINDLRRGIDPLIEEIKEKYKKEKAIILSSIRSQAEEIGNRIIGQFLDNSQVSVEDAEKWASQIKINSSLKEKLININYPIEAFKADIAEFYRLANGKVKDIEFKARAGDRAYASDSSAVDSGFVAITSDMNKSVLFHEMAHHLEADFVARLTANEFLRKRRSSDKTALLSKLTGNSRYKGERAYEDSFLNPYVGKYYGDGLTEVFSMGVEQFSDPTMLIEAIAKDPHHIKIMASYLQQPRHPLFDAVIKSAALSKKAKNDFDESVEKETEKYLNIIDKHVQIDLYAEEPKYPDTHKKELCLKKYLGKIGDYYVYKSLGRTGSDYRLLSCTRLLEESNSWFGFTLSPDVKMVKAIYLKNKGNIINKTDLKLNELRELAESLETENA